MLYFAHSINSLEALNKISLNIGVEVDIRDQGDRLVIGHDPLKRKYNEIEPF